MNMKLNNFALEKILKFFLKDRYKNNVLQCLKLIVVHTHLLLSSYQNYNTINFIYKYQKSIRV